MMTSPISFTLDEAVNLLDDCLQQLEQYQLMTATDQKIAEVVESTGCSS